MNPYETLPDNAFWKLAVASKSMFDIESLWSPKFKILPNHKVVTFGSCFAQHIGNALKAQNFNWLVTEPAPPGLHPQVANQYNYGIFSARTGNIYTASLLKQWIRWSLKKAPVPSEVWEKDGRYYDPFRPRIEPNGFDSEKELFISRQHSIHAFRVSIEQANFFVFTLGLTESWFNEPEGYEYPMCPGTVGGTFDPKLHRFVNQKFHSIIKSIREAMDLMRELNPKLKFIFTVSPVPLTATNSGNHVLTATMESKSVLRAVAGQLASQHRYIDYFPSYEIINSPVFKGTFFEPNLRSINPYGVKLVMNTFFKCLTDKFGSGGVYKKANSAPVKPRGRNLAREKAQENDPHCEEALLEAFSGRS